MIIHFIADLNGCLLILNYDPEFLVSPQRNILSTSTQLKQLGIVNVSINFPSLFLTQVDSSLTFLHKAICSFQAETKLPAYCIYSLPTILLALLAACCFSVQAICESCCRTRIFLQLKPLQVLIIFTPCLFYFSCHIFIFLRIICLLPKLCPERGAQERKLRGLWEKKRVSRSCLKLENSVSIPLGCK